MVGAANQNREYKKPGFAEGTTRSATAKGPIAKPPSEMITHLILREAKPGVSNRGVSHFFGKGGTLRECSLKVPS